MTTSVDVLAVMDELYRALPPIKSDGSAFVMNWEMDRRQHAYGAARAAVAELIAFAESFSFTVTDSFYKDAYLGVDFPKSKSHPHGKQIVYRLPTPSNMSLDMAEIERMRTAALARVKGA